VTDVSKRKEGDVAGVRGDEAFDEKFSSGDCGRRGVSRSSSQGSEVEELTTSDDVRVRQLNTLRRSGTSACVHDQSNVVRLREVLRMRVLPPDLKELLKPDDLDIRPFRLDLLQRLYSSGEGEFTGRAIEDENLDRRGTGEDAGKGREEGGVGEEAVDGGLDKGVLELSSGKGGVSGGPKG
jgi:hypothetical protein